jgi:hypothetical protein
MDRGTQVLIERVITLSSNVLNHHDRERPKETAKKLSEVEKCQILGYCGLLSWSEQHLMPTILADLKKKCKRRHRKGRDSGTESSMGEGTDGTANRRNGNERPDGVTRARDANTCKNNIGPTTAKNASPCKRASFPRGRVLGAIAHEPCKKRGDWVGASWPNRM